MNKMLLPLMILILFAGCAKKQDVVALSQKMDALENEIGPYRYGAFHPKVKLSFLKEELEKSSYGTANYNYSGIVKLTEEFPVERIGLAIELEVIFTEDFACEDTLFVEIDEGSVAFEDYAYMGDFPDTLSDIRPEIQITGAYWWPITELFVEIERK